MEIGEFKHGHHAGVCISPAYHHAKRLRAILSAKFPALFPDSFALNP